MKQQQQRKFPLGSTVREPDYPACTVFAKGLKLSVLMLCALVFIFTSGSSALLGRPCCGLSIWLSLLAIFKIIFWVYAFIFLKTKRTKPENTQILRMTRKWLLGAQSINTESSLSLTLSNQQVWGVGGEKWLALVHTPQKEVFMQKLSQIQY